ncbi:prolyl aminopeptidase [Marinibactrum halimedae]|uniref:Proline iminopeptidase n=1 Tax=Marinibactrum halimedae TaxID=1444977 RepID=A0AA37T4U9_9GAMM|nr:prolyl aminopeptidase [Marinibactrum halimedae]MCD9459300.1 prolyl aminopeptidase [Marinibactrum halimedae]GLS25809.1 proline iminopeptidase [Marinibactrum halimedae]
MQVLYPEIKPYRHELLAVSDLHNLYVEECGNPDGIPVLVVHGGPGGGCTHHDRCYFDPEKYRIILLDQRGAGRSTPHAELEDNTTTMLIADMEAVRVHLGVEKWILFGGSWGATLSLLYAQSNPDRVLGLILRGVFLCRERDLKWFYQGGASHVFPDYWKEFIKPIPPSEHDDFIQAYHNVLTGPNELAKMAAAKAWSMWEGQCATLRPCHDVLGHFTDPHTAVSLAAIETHYFVNKGFIRENQILENIDKIEGIPGIIVHGRYDMICPLDNAMELHNQWMSSELNIIRDAGHASREPGIVDALVRATKEMARRYADDYLNPA